MIRRFNVIMNNWTENCNATTKQWTSNLNIKTPNLLKYAADIRPFSTKVSSGGSEGPQ